MCSFLLKIQIFTKCTNEQQTYELQSAEDGNQGNQTNTVLYDRTKTNEY